MDGGAPRRIREREKMGSVDTWGTGNDPRVYMVTRLTLDPALGAIKGVRTIRTH